MPGELKFDLKPEPKLIQIDLHPVETETISDQSSYLK